MEKIKKNIVFFLIFILVSCSGDDNTITPLESTEISVVYETTRIENTFLIEGATSAPVVNWRGEKGTFTSTSEVVVNGDVIIDENTGVISWKSSMPLGEVELEIEATNSIQSTVIKIMINTTFIEGVFVGGFNNDTSGEPDYSNIDFGTYIHFFNNGTVSLSKPDDLLFSGTGTWQSDGAKISIKYITTESSPDELVMVGFIANDTSRASFEGIWGSKGLDSDGSVKMPEGVFSFRIT